MSWDLKIGVDTSAAKRLLDQSPAALARAISLWLRDGGEQIVKPTMQGIIQDRVKNSKTGQLAGGVQVQVGQGFATIGPNVDYALWTDQPTKPHVIEPRNKQALAFPMAGGRISRNAAGQVSTVFKFGGKTVRRGAVFATRVFHPGTRGMFYIRDTATRVVDPLANLLNERVADSLSRLEGGKE